MDNNIINYNIGDNDVDINNNKCWNKYTTKFFIDETNMSISWNSYKATKILVYLMKLYNMPHTLNLNQNGMAHFNNYNLKNNVYYEQPCVWYEIIINDDYNYGNSSNKYLNPLYCYYFIKLSSQEIDRIALLNKFGVYYDINKTCICVNNDNYLECHYILKITLDILKNNDIVINKFATYLKSMKNKYNTKRDINMLIYKVYSFQL